eukprot:2270789-Prymnesium_polylepis.1
MCGFEGGLWRGTSLEAISSTDCGWGSGCLVRAWFEGRLCVRVCVWGTSLEAITSTESLLRSKAEKT